MDSGVKGRFGRLIAIVAVLIMAALMAAACGATAAAQADGTAKVVQHYQGIARSLDEKETQQADLVRNVKTSEDNYLLYMRKREEARISDALDSKRIVNVAIAEAATVPAFPTLHLGWVLIWGIFHGRDCERGNGVRRGPAGCFVPHA